MSRYLLKAICAQFALFLSSKIHLTTGHIINQGILQFNIFIHVGKL